MTLELETATACDAALLKLSLPEGVHVSGEPVVYDPDADGITYREVDYVATLYREFLVNNRTGIQLNFSLPIECKSRRDVEYFAYGMNHTEHVAPFPLASQHYSSPLFNVAQSAQTSAFANGLRARIVSMVIKDGQTPEKVDDENLIYNSGGALYDFRSLRPRNYDDRRRRREDLHLN